MRITTALKSPLILALGILCLIATGAAAHFKLNQNVRIHHVSHNENGIEVFLRMPLAYLLADKLGPVDATTGLPGPAPYTTNLMENGTLMHRVSPTALRADPSGLAELMAESLRLEGEYGHALEATAHSVRVHTIGTEPGFATLAEAQEALSAADVFATDGPAPYVGDAMIDVHLSYGDAPITVYSISHLSDPGLPGQEDTANLVLDYSDGDVRTYRVAGLMHEPLEVTGSQTAAASTFLVEGIRHILEGLDHVLFVLCMIIGAANLRALLARVTGFTVGHTATLILGFFGVAPQGAWFIPTVELAIALSIVFAAAEAVFRPATDAKGNRRALAVTTGIGLLHGFGFSFMLHQILRVDAPNVWQSLLAFNVGVEVGQVAIVLLVWPLVVMLRRMPEQVWPSVRATVAAGAAITAVFWVVERSEFLL